MELSVKTRISVAIKGTESFGTFTVFIVKVIRVKANVSPTLLVVFVQVCQIWDLIATE